MALVDASISLGGRVDLHLRLDAMLATPELADLISEQVIIEQWSGLLGWYRIQIAQRHGNMLTCKYRWPYSSLPSLYHTILGLGFPWQVTLTDLIHKV